MSAGLRGEARKRVVTRFECAGDRVWLWRLGGRC